MVLRGFERRLERLVEGTFARAFKSGVKPVELGRRLMRTMDDERSVDVRGRTIAPNHFVVGLSDTDLARFGEVREALRRELAEVAREHARDRGYAFLGPVAVVLQTEPGAREGRFAIAAAFREGVGGTGAGSLVFPDGGRFALGDKAVVIGRLADCDIALDDPNASRRHAEIRPEGADYVVHDLRSTNGTRVNGHLIERHVLGDGDRLAIGAWQFVFEAS